MSEGTIAVLGMFDGVHIGHQALFHCAMNLKQQTKLPITVVTFRTHPKELLGQAPKMLCTNDEKRTLCMEFGVDKVVFLPFDETMKTMMPEQFVKTYLIDELNSKYVVVGENYCFGSCRSGTPKTLKLFDEFQTKIVPTVYSDGEIVCSSRIRSLLLAGEVEKALKYLGHDLVVYGVVEQGRKLGNTLGFPTANIKTFFPPLANGVYVTETKIDDIWYPSVSNFGIIPTFLDGNTSILETHILNYNEIIYEKVIAVRFLSFIRPEKKFSCTEQLVEQIKRDKERAKQFFSYL